LGAVGGGAFAYHAAYRTGSLLRSGTGPLRELADRRVPATDGAPRLVVARGPSPSTNTRAALQGIGGMGRFVDEGDVVAIKANVGFANGPYHATTTNPEVVASVVRACRDAGAARVLVIDCPALMADRNFSASGIRRAALEAGAEVLDASGGEFIQAELPGFGTWPVFEAFASADKLINAPVTKQHGLARTTTGMKNWYGALGGVRRKLHPRMAESIVALAQLFRPTLTVIDSTRVLMRNGPRGGNLDDVKQVDAVATTVDPVAGDAWAATLLDVDPTTLGWLGAAERAGLGSADFRTSFRELRAG
jgi:uncharacterized protein (DUF362 family)